ncbi:hypothetical protein Ae201684P_007556 [Aphanomyces euteiches]|uniref:Amino acid permease/ SLC12A domain-containing protein n=1 Tax=Aphanomyces euteiches TaxID=100861 RepID=A0A6G0WEP9_9STRA|nr:hypothetical protein Ae201684_016318 [Aphanomyces euteiches]KAH9079847.1 hypothetical protein Ae201684P_007556 [Aphanomyces euteiches]
MSEREEKATKYIISCKHIWAIGFTMIINGQVLYWNEGVIVGSVDYGLMILISGLAFLSLALSMAEMSSMLPFAGGVYGLSRCAIGFQAGFILGCAEVLDYVVNAASLTALFIACLAQQWPELTPFEPLLLVVSVVFTCAILLMSTVR